MVPHAATWNHTGAADVAGAVAGLVGDLVDATLDVNATTLRWLESLTGLYAPLPEDLCGWLADDCEVAVANCTANKKARIPRDVCKRLTDIGFPTNETTEYCRERAPRLEGDDVIRGSLLAVLALLSVVGNSYTIQSIRNKASPAPVYKLILHLSVADVLVSLVCIAGEAVWMLMVQWKFGNVACKVFKFLEMTALHGSSYVVVLIAQNRWVAVSHPLASRRSRPSLRGHVKDVLRCNSPRSVLFVWVLGACASVPQLFLFSVQEGPFYEQFYQCVTYDVGAKAERVYNIVNFVTLFVAPLLVIVVSYLSIYCTLSKGQREIGSVNKMIVTHDQNRQRRLKRAMVKSRWIAGVIVCAYLAFWLPYYITMLVYFLAPAQDEDRDRAKTGQGDRLLLWYNSKWMEWIFFCGMTNSVFNPAIYGLFQLWKPKRQRQWSFFRQRDGSTQLTQFTDSFRRQGAVAMTPADSPHSADQVSVASASSQGPPPTMPAATSPSPVFECTPPTPEAACCTPEVTVAPTTPAASPEAPVQEAMQTLLGDAATPRTASTTPIVRTVATKSGPLRAFSWRNRFLRKYRALRAHTAHQAHI